MELLILDTSFKAITLFDTFESLIWSDRYSTNGDVELCIPVSKDALEMLRYDYYMWIKESDHVMIIEDKKIVTDFEEGNKLLVTGRSLESILDRRIIWNKTILTGNLQNGVQKLLNENIINPTDVKRKISNFVFEASADAGITSLTLEAQFTGENLYTVISRICEVNGLGFKITLNDSNQFVFKLYLGKDRTYDQLINPHIVFSPEYENVINSNYLESKKTLKTVALVAGEEFDSTITNVEDALDDYLNGTDDFIEVTDGVVRKTTIAAAASGEGTGVDRREMFTDALDIRQTVDGVKMDDATYLSQLEYRGSAELSENTFTQSFEGELETTHTFEFGVDYFMGDKVQIVNEYGIESVVRVTELVMSQDATGFVMHPTFSTVE